MRRARAVTLLSMMLALALAGCGSSDGGDRVASASDRPSSDTTAGAASDLSRDEMAVKFAQCMRENGIDMADPEPGKGIRIQSRGNREEMEAAMEACREYNPQANSTGSPELDEKNREFAQCMRKNGVENFPDPEPGQLGIRIDEKVAEDPDLPAAQRACESVLTGGR